MMVDNSVSKTTDGFELKSKTLDSKLATCGSTVPSASTSASVSGSTGHSNRFLKAWKASKSKKCLAMMDPRGGEI